MPTARPIIITMLSANTDTMNPSPSSAVRAAPTMIATTPSASGTRAATTEPNTTTRMSSAIGMPIASPRRRSLSATSEASRSHAPVPVRTTVKPFWPSAPLTMSYRRVTCSSTSPDGTDIVTGRMAVRRSAETRAAAWPAACRAAASAALTAAGSAPGAASAARTAAAAASAATCASYQVATARTSCGASARIADARSRTRAA